MQAMMMGEIDDDNDGGGDEDIFTKQLLHFERAQGGDHGGQAVLPSLAHRPPMYTLTSTHMYVCEYSMVPRAQGRHCWPVPSPPRLASTLWPCLPPTSRPSMWESPNRRSRKSSRRRAEAETLRHLHRRDRQHRGSRSADESASMRRLKKELLRQLDGVGGDGYQWGGDAWRDQQAVGAGQRPAEEVRKETLHRLRGRGDEDEAPAPPPPHRWSRRMGSLSTSSPT